MSSIVLSPGATGAAAFTIEAPSTATSRVITLPDATDTLVGKATTDTLTNKSIAATQLTGTVAVARLPTGSVLQVVNATYSTRVTNTTQTNADSGLTATITPSSATSKVLCIVNMAGLYNSAVTNLGHQIQLIRGSTNIVQFAAYTNYLGAGYSLFTHAGTNYLDSPATTSATTYKVQFCKPDGTVGTISVQQNGDTSTISLMEIAA